MDEFHKHHLEGKKVDIKEYVPYFIYIISKTGETTDDVRSQGIIYLQEGLAGVRDY